MVLHHRYFSLALIIAASSPAQDRYTLNGPAPIRVESNLVLIDALVTDRQGAAIQGLSASSFRIYENGKQQVIKYCVSEDVPASIGLILDTSGSVSSKLAFLKQAAVQLVRVGNASDEYSVIEFRDRPRLVLPLTADIERVTQSIGHLQAGGTTALLDALHLAMTEIQHGNNPRRALLVISDGVDNHSRYTESETRRLIAELDVPIYTIDLYERLSGHHRSDPRPDPEILETLSILTGGRSFRAFEPKEFSKAANLIATEIRHEYVIGYIPSNRDRDGKFHRVRVQVESLKGQSFRISHRGGYYVPLQ